MSIRDRARTLRKVIEGMAAKLTDEHALETVELFPSWSADGAYQTGDRVRYDGILYKCLQAHTAQESWTPSDSPSLWVRVDDPSIEWPEWVQPTGSTDAYPMGAKVSHNGRHWVSTVDTNVWEPGIYGWEEAE